MRPVLMVRGAIVSLAALWAAFAVAGCDLEKAYQLKNPSTGEQATCLAWANTFFDVGMTNDPRPFRNCIAACRKHGFVSISRPPAGVSEDGEGSDTFVPQACH